MTRITLIASLVGLTALAAPAHTEQGHTIQNASPPACVDEFIDIGRGWVVAWHLGAPEMLNIPDAVRCYYYRVELCSGGPDAVIRDSWLDEMAIASELCTCDSDDRPFILLRGMIPCADQWGRLRLSPTGQPRRLVGSCIDGPFDDDPCATMSPVWIDPELPGPITGEVPRCACVDQCSSESGG